MKKILLFAAMALFTISAAAQGLGRVNLEELITLMPDYMEAQRTIAAVSHETSETFQAMVIMLPVMFQNSWMPTVFEDFLNNDWMPRANSTAPAVNVKESEKAYTMELAAPGIKKEYCRVSINDEGNLTIAIENKAEHKHEDKHHHYLRREFSYSNYEQNYTLPDDVVKDQISAKARLRRSVRGRNVPNVLSVRRRRRARRSILWNSQPLASRKNIVA